MEYLKDFSMKLSYSRIINNSSVINWGIAISLLLLLVSFYFYEYCMSEEKYYYMLFPMILVLFFYYQKKLLSRVKKIKQRNNYILEKEYEQCINALIRETEYFRKLFIYFFIFNIGLISYFFKSFEESNINNFISIIQNNELFNYILILSINCWIYIFLLTLVAINLLDNYHMKLEDIIQERNIKN